MKYWIWAGILFTIDMTTKWLAKFFLAKNSIEIIPNFFELKLSFNEGVAFSLPIPRFFQIFLTLVFFTAFFWWAQKYFSKISKLEKWGSVFLLSGTVGNFWERVVFGQVTDFLSFDLQFWHFPIFNIADICIFVGVVLWVIGGFGKEKAQ